MIRSKKDRPIRPCSAIAECMHRLVTDAALVRTLAEAGPIRAAQFPWRTTAEGTLDALRDALEAPDDTLEA